MNYIDLDKILQPISFDCPCGTPAENFPLYDKIIRYCESDEDGMNDKQGWSYQPRKSDWPKVKALCEEMLETQSKDLQVLCWLAQALTELESVAGATEGVTLIERFLSQYWETLYPVEENDFAFRESHLNGLDRLFSRYLLTLTFDDENIISLFNWKRVQLFEQRVAANPDVRKRLIKEGDFSLQEWHKMIAVTAGSHIAVIREECLNLNQAIDALEFCLCQQLGVPWQGFLDTREKIGELLEFFSRFYPEQQNDQLQNKEGTQLTETVAPLVVQLPSGDNHPPPPSVGSSGQQATYSDQRAQAIRQLEMVSALFRENEPGSPIPYLLERAIRWSAMNTIEWMADIFSEHNPHYMDGVSALLGPKHAHEIQVTSVMENQQRGEYQEHRNEMISAGQSGPFDEYQGDNRFSPEQGEFNGRIVEGNDNPYDHGAHY